MPDRPPSTARNAPVFIPPAPEQGIFHVGDSARWRPPAASIGGTAGTLRALQRAATLLADDNPAAALQAASQACMASPDDPRATLLRTRALLALERYESIVASLEFATPAAMLPQTWALLGDAHRHLGQARQAMSAYMEALGSNPSDGSLHYRLGLCFDDLWLKAEAVECFKTALLLELGPIQAGVRDMLVFYERQLGAWDEGEQTLAAVRAMLRELPQGQALRTNPFTHATLLDDPADLLRSARACSLSYAAAVRPVPRRKPVRGRRIKVGYVSSDFHNHATSLLMAQMLECHDRGAFEIVLYDHGRDDGSGTRSRVLAAAERRVDIRCLGDDAAARRIREDKIDILVDLKGYTRGARPGLFARRPAPVQVAYLGFPGTSGAEFIDYIIGDAWVTPLEAEADFSERIAQLPGCYQCNDGLRELPERVDRASCGLPPQALVLCGFTQPYKISPEVFDVWCRLLGALPAAVLWLLDDNPQATAALRRHAQARGIDPTRLAFAPKMEHRAHLRRLGCADLFLDTWPCNGHTTVSDALWAGVPVVTWSGRTFASRVAGSLLRTLGFAELVCADVAGYEALSIDLARDEGRRRALRSGIEAARIASPLFDGATKARQLESLFLRMWDRALQALPVAHLPAED
jgi:predicted O-linked N-acetylglucosamine transferase (SPINDLY family)